MLLWFMFAASNTWSELRDVRHNVNLISFTDWTTKQLSFFRGRYVCVTSRLTMWKRKPRVGVQNLCVRNLSYNRTGCHRQQMQRKESGRSVGGGRQLIHSDQPSTCFSVLNLPLPFGSRVNPTKRLCKQVFIIFCLQKTLVTHTADHFLRAIYLLRSRNLI